MFANFVSGLEAIIRQLYYFKVLLARFQEVGRWERIFLLIEDLKRLWAKVRLLRLNVTTAESFSEYGILYKWVVLIGVQHPIFFPPIT